MANNTPNIIQKKANRRREQRAARIDLPDGDVLIPREDFAKKVGVSDRTARRLNFPTVFIAGYAFVKQNASLQIIADKVKRKNEPPKRRRP
jgi:hypothetical protein